MVCGDEIAETRYRDRLTEKTDVKASLSTIWRVLQRLELTRKKGSPGSAIAQSERVQNLRSQYWTTIREVCLKDEAGEEIDCN